LILRGGYIPNHRQISKFGQKVLRFGMQPTLHKSAAKEKCPESRVRGLAYAIRNGQAKNMVRAGELVDFPLPPGPTQAILAVEQGLPALSGLEADYTNDHEKPSAFG
jgi:hypothetical protein